MNGRQLGSILIAYIALQTAVQGIGGLAELPKLFGPGSVEPGDQWPLLLVSLAAVLVFAVGPAVLLLALRGQIGALFDVGAGSLLASLSVEQLSAALLLFVGVNQILGGLLGGLSRAVAAQAIGWGPEQAITVGVSAVQLFVGIALVLRGRRIAEWWARSTGVAT